MDTVEKLRTLVGSGSVKRIETYEFNPPSESFTTISIPIEDSNIININMAIEGSGSGDYSTPYQLKIANNVINMFITTNGTVNNTFSKSDKVYISACLMVSTDRESISGVVEYNTIRDPSSYRTNGFQYITGTLNNNCLDIYAYRENRYDNRPTIKHKLCAYFL